MKVRLDHIGIAVDDAAAALACYRDALGLRGRRTPRRWPSQQVRAHFLPTGTALLELLEATAPDSPIARFLESAGPGCTTSRWRSTTSTPRWPSCGRPACG